MEQWKRLLLPIVAGIGRRASAADDAVAAPTTTTTLEYEKDENCTREGKKRKRSGAISKILFFQTDKKSRFLLVSGDCGLAARHSATGARTVRRAPRVGPVARV